MLFNVSVIFHFMAEGYAAAGTQCCSGKKSVALLLTTTSLFIYRTLLADHSAALRHAAVQFVYGFFYFFLYSISTVKYPC
jgi:hypothetical protein